MIISEISQLIQMTSLLLRNYIRLDIRPINTVIITAITPSLLN